MDIPIAEIAVIGVGLTAAAAIVAVVRTSGIHVFLQGERVLVAHGKLDGLLARGCLVVSNLHELMIRSKRWGVRMR